MASNVTNSQQVDVGSYTCKANAAAHRIIHRVTRSGSPLPSYFEGRLLTTADVAVLDLPPIAYPSTDYVDFDISPYLQAYMNTSDTAVYDPQDGGIYSASYDEAGTPAVLAFGYKFAVSDLDADSYNASSAFIALNVSLPVSRRYGSNLAGYIATATGSPLAIVTAGKWLTTFERPTIWHYKGVVLLPSVAFIVSDEMTNTLLDVLVLRQKIGTGSYELSPSNDIAKEGGAYAVPFASGSNATFYAAVIAAQTLLLSVWQLDSLSPVTLGDQWIEEITFDVQEACYAPTFLRWRDSLGSFHIWAFEGSKPTTKSGEDSDTYAELQTAYGTPTTGDLPVQNWIVRTLQKVSASEMVVGAHNLTNAQALALSEILRSPNVSICMNDFDTDTIADHWVNVLVKGGSVSYDPFRNSQKVSFTIQLPAEYNVMN